MIRRRMTILVLGLLAVVIGGFSIAVFVATREAVQAEVRRDVTNRMNSLVRAIGREPDAVADGYVTRFAVTDVVVVVFDSTGRVLARSDTLPDRTVDFEPTLFTSMRIEEIDAGGRLIVAGSKTTTPDGDEVFVVVGRSPDRTYDTLATLAGVLVPGTLLALLTTGIGVHLLLRRSLGPLEQLGLDGSDRGDLPRRRGRGAGRSGRHGSTVAPAAAPAWAWPSPATWPRPTVAPLRCRARSGRAVASS